MGVVELEAARVEHHAGDRRLADAPRPAVAHPDRTLHVVRHVVRLRGREILRDEPLPLGVLSEHEIQRFEDLLRRRPRAGIGERGPHRFELSQEPTGDRHVEAGQLRSDRHGRHLAGRVAGGRAAGWIRQTALVQPDEPRARPAPAKPGTSPPRRRQRWRAPPSRPRGSGRLGRLEGDRDRQVPREHGRFRERTRRAFAPSTSCGASRSPRPHGACLRQLSSRRVRVRRLQERRPSSCGARHLAHFSVELLARAHRTTPRHGSNVRSESPVGGPRRGAVPPHQSRPAPPDRFAGVRLHPLDAPEGRLSTPHGHGARDHGPVRAPPAP